MRMTADDAIATNANDTKKLVLIDGNALLYRGFFAMRALTTSAGQPTNAVFSFTMMLLTLLEQQKPDVILCAWDAPVKTFRHEAYEEYKGQRKAAPPELVEQGPLAREMAAAFHIPTVEAPGWEADDVIGTLAGRAKALGYDVLIVTGDLDALQLVEPGVRVMTTVKGVTDTVIYDEAAVEARYGLHPDQLADYRALKGDTSDNIPGVPGVGEKTAAQLLQKFGHVEELLQRTDEVAPPKLQAAVAESAEQIVLSKHLATIVRDVPLPGVDLPALDAAPHAPDWQRVRALFERLEFRTMLRRLPQTLTPQPSLQTLTPRPPLSQAREGEPEALRAKPGAGSATNPELPPLSLAREGDLARLRAAGGESLERGAGGEATAAYLDADTPELLGDLARAARGAHRIGVRLHVTDGILDSVLLGVAVAVGDGTVYYVPLASESSPPAPLPAAGSGGTSGGTPSLFDEPEEAAPAPTPPPAELPDVLKALLEDERVPKIAHDAKSDIGVLRRSGAALRGVVFDTELAAYLLSAGRRASFPLAEVAGDYAGRELSPLDKKERKAMDDAAIRAHERGEALAEADALLAVAAVQEPRLAAEGLTAVLNDLELPVAPILAEMELAGLPVDVSVLQRISREMSGKIAELERQIFEIAGGPFAIGSTKQLQEVLFEKLKLPAGKKTKTGYSTGADVLDELAPEYPIANLILQHRELSKLKSTYADAMPALVRPDDHRLHTSLNQTVAATGRLSSSNPNLQNIPVRTEIGREIRRAFVAGPGKALVAADYSQIELRLFAHVSKDAELTAAFASGEDIHSYTASRIYGVALGDVTREMRAAAKMTNYAVIYGISDFVLARRLGISMPAAKELKASYFARFPGLKRYMDETLDFAREHGYVQTLFGRRRYMPDINSRVFQFRQASERAAINMPIQGSSADIMKLAMIRVHAMLERERLRSVLLLQVHDELLFEAPEDEVPALAARVRDEMAHAYPLDVALDVEVKTGKTWADVTPVAEMGDTLATAAAD